MKKKKNKIKGFSLVELMVSMFIFVLVITASVSVFSRVIIDRKKNRDIQRNMEEGRTAMEVMAKNIRMSSNLTSFSGGKGIRMLNNSQDVCIAYEFKNGKLYAGLENPPSDPCVLGANQEMISKTIDGSFVVVETSESPKHIGKATINMTIGSLEPLKQHLQTTVSFRDYGGIL